MLTSAERNSLLLSLSFLILGAGIKAWKRWRVEIGPFDPAATAATPLDLAPTGSSPPVLPKDSLPADAHVPPLAAFASDTGADSSRGDASQAPFAESRKPVRRETAKSAKTPPACPVDANRASEDRLANLPGVGPRTAAALVAFRKEHGPFREIRQLLQVKGIGEKKLGLMAPCLELSGAADP